MATPVPATKNSAISNRPLVPPDEQFWIRYSPHHEFSLSSLGSIVVHAGIIGGLILVGTLLAMRRDSDVLRPPTMDVVQMSEGGAGDGNPGGQGDGNIRKGDPDGPKEFRKVANASPEKPNLQSPTINLANLPKTETNLEMPTLDGDDPSVPALDNSALTQLNKAALEQVDKAMEIARTSFGTKEGVVGGQGPGYGKGIGDKKGDGTGSGTPGTRTATRAEILAWRWRFDLTGNPKQHAEKLDAIGVVLALGDGRGGFYLVRDLKRRPVPLEKADMTKYKDAVKWFNTRPESVAGLAQELKLPFQPQFVVILLPKDREEKVAAEEARYAQQRNRPVQTVRATWFDFEFRDGGYEPVATKQE